MPTYSKDRDPNLPCYQCDDYVDQLRRWELASKVFDGPEESTASRFSCWLPQNSAEHPDDYKQRLMSSVFLWEPRYRKAIEGFASILSNIHGSPDLPPSLVSRWDDIDLNGSSIFSFFRDSSTTSCKLGGCFVLVDYSGSPVAGSAADELVDRTPYLVRYSPEDVINWRFDIVDGQLRLSQCTIIQITQVPDGTYGSRLETSYRVLTPGLSQMYRVVEGDNNTYSAVLLDEREMLNKKGQPLLEIPLAYIPASEASTFNVRSPLDPIAYLNVHLWQIESDRNNVMHKCNLPTACLGDRSLGNDRNGVPIERKLTIGPYRWIEHSELGKFYFAEPSGSALEQTKKKVDDVRHSIDQLSLDFLTDTVSQTATEAGLKATSVRASLQGMALQINSALADIKRHWCNYTLEADTGTLNVDESVLDSAMTPEVARFVMDLIDRGLLTYRTGMSTLQKGKVIAEGIDLEVEAAELKATRSPDMPATSEISQPALASST